MSARKLIVFEHASALGNQPAHLLFERVHCKRKDAKKPARVFGDYVVTVDETPIDGVTFINKL